MNFLLLLFFFLIPVVAAIVPRGIAAGIDTIGLACGIQLFLQRKQVDWSHSQKSAWRNLRWIIAALAFIALSSFWSVSPRALEMLRDTSLVTISAMLIFTASHLWSGPLIDRALRWFFWSALLTFALFTLHAALGYPLNLHFNHVPSLDVLLSTNIPKRSAALFALLMWPLALAAYRFARPVLASPILVTATLMTLTLPSRAAILGAIFGLLTYAIAEFMPRAARGIGFVVLPLAMPLMLVFALFIPYLLPRLPADWADRLPLSGEFRLEIWDYAAHKAVEHMPLGIGIDGSRTLASPADHVTVEATMNSLMPDHPHNVFLQLWLEGGLIGALLTIGFSWLLWQQLRRLPQHLQPFAWGYTVTAVITLGVAYGTWQAWWLGGHALSAFLLALLCRQEEIHPHDEFARAAPAPAT